MQARQREHFTQQQQEKPTAPKTDLPRVFQSLPTSITRRMHLIETDYVYIRRWCILYIFKFSTYFILIHQIAVLVQLLLHFFSSL